MTKPKPLFTKNEKILLFIGLLIIISTLGVKFNWLAVISNGCRMPVHTYTLNVNTSTHFSFTNENQVQNYLATDIVNLPFIEGYISIGDIIIIFCITTAIILMRIFMRGKYKEWSKPHAKS